MQESLDEIKLYYDRGKAYLQKGQVESAIENLQKVIQLQPDFANAYLHLGAAYYALGQPEQAIDHIQKHIKLQPGSAVAYISLGNVYASMEQRQKAIECYAKAAELQPKDATPYYCIGIIHCQLGNYRAAIDNFKIALDLQPHSEAIAKFSLADVYINMGAAYIELKQYKQAVLSCLKAIELEPKDVKAYNNLGVAYASLGRYDSAIEHFKHASKLQPSNASTHFNLGVIFSRLDKRNEAVSHFSRIIHEDDTDDIQSSPLEVVYAQLRQPGDFIMTRDQVVEIQPDEEATAHSTLAEAYSSKEQYRIALLSYRRAIELQPDSAMAYYNLGKLYFKHQEELQGIECFSKVVELQPDDEIYQKALDTILLFGDARVVKPLIIIALESNDKYSRLSSVSLLGKIGDERAINPLIELLDDSDEVIRQYAAEALINFLEKAVAPLIQATKSHKSEYVRWHAAYILGQIGTTDALRALEDIGKQGAEGSKVKQMAKKAIGGIRERTGYSRKRTLWSIFSGR